MVFDYIPAEDGCLRQGEYLEGLFEYRPLADTTVDVYQEDSVTWEKVNHPLVVVVSQGCDLLRDFEARCLGQESQLSHVLLCDLFTKDVIRDRQHIVTARFSNIESNQVERYHTIPEAHVGNDERDVIPTLYTDFRGVISIPVDFVYARVNASLFRRRCVLPQPYLQYLIHRLYSFLGRVALP